MNFIKLIGYSHALCPPVYTRYGYDDVELQTNVLRSCGVANDCRRRHFISVCNLPVPKANSAFYPFGVDKLSTLSDVCRSHHLVNAHVVKPVRLIQSLCAVCGSNLAGLTLLCIVLPCMADVITVIIARYVCN